MSNEIYAFWNNKGGTGKTSLAFQAITAFAREHADDRVLAVDLCPQANLSELLLGGMLGGGTANLLALQARSPRATIGGYFQQRLPSPYSVPQFRATDYIVSANSFNGQVPRNIDLVAGDAIVELQANAVSTLSNTQIPGTNTWISVIDWLADFLDQIRSHYSYVFIDSNPSFSIYTQIALASATRLILPVMADDSSRRAVQNALSLLYGFQLPSPIYSQYNFSSKLTAAGRQLPMVHRIVKNRLTQYMGPASAYAAVLRSIDADLSNAISSHQSHFTFTTAKAGCIDVRDFQTTGVVAHAEGTPFFSLQPGKHQIGKRNVTVNSRNLTNCRSAITTLAAAL